ncbi:MAG: hypothetical protein ACI8RD_004610 [Bacillariaceae sp.]|jgi:hypothetical protein
MATPVPLIFQEALNVSPTMVEAFQCFDRADN